jgi:hypothetical protein
MPKPRRPRTAAPHPHEAFIELVGQGWLREQFGLTPQRLHNWKIRGIPTTHRSAVARMAMLKEVAIPDGFLDPPEGMARQPEQAAA